MVLKTFIVRIFKKIIFIYDPFSKLLITLIQLIRARNNYCLNWYWKAYTYIYKRIFRKLWKFPFSTRLNKSVIYIYIFGTSRSETKNSNKFKKWKNFSISPVKYVAGGEKISENIGIGEGERERARITRQVVGDWPWEIFVSPRFVRAGVRVPQRWSEVTSRTHERSHCHPPRCAAITNAFQTRNRRVLSSLALPRPPTSSAFSFLLILSLYIYMYFTCKYIEHDQPDTFSFSSSR